MSINSVLKKKAEQQKVEIKSFDIIYELTDYLANLLLGMVEIEQEEVTVGKLEVLGIFFTETREMTIGGMVIGTIVSLFVLPLVYWWLYRKEEIKNKL